jgi:hypothetical protein
MGKPKETRVIQTEWAKDDFEYHGFAIEMRKTWFIFMPLVIAFVTIGAIIDNQKVGDVLVVISLLTFMVWYLTIYIRGRKFWKDNKDKEQPIKVERIPNLFGRKQK